MIKKIIIIATVVLVIFLLALVGYYFILRSNESTSTGTPLTFKSFFSFGGEVTSTTTIDTPRTPEPEPTQTANYVQKLRRLSDEPVAGMAVVDSPKGTTVRYTDKATGHIFDIELFSPEQNRISNVTGNIVYRALWGNGGNSVINQYLKDDNQTIDSYAVTFSKISTTTESTMTGTSLPSNVDAVDILGKDIFYIQPSSAGSVGFISSVDGSKVRQIWNSPIRELLAQFVTPSIIALATKPSPNINGYLYFVNTASGQVRRILGDVPGLSALVSPDATQVFYLTQGNNTVQMKIRNVANSQERSINPVTFPEKCVWSKKDIDVVYCAVPQEQVSATSLSSWYFGLVSYTDDIWKYDFANNTSNIIAHISTDGGQAIDVERLTLSQNEQYIVFINRINGTLWSLDLTK